ncbi:MAG: GH3 auxin-responsive promoter family protein, partial [Bacteroidota bacterium]|nr:GH3 auxin-responsive promoter family protein [Bacteroidota bacterium]MDX5429429.1 GH3 auxin-responsive promoter family protein [Bacteroidota bacterium]MDX5468220.1 GH3 auxin-responsive promoter family protein [Bacteroidota bacterium]
MSSLFSWYFRKRWTELEAQIRMADDVQKETLFTLLDQAKNTEFGKAYDFKSISSYEAFRERVPIGDYESVKPFIERTMKGEQNLIWPSDIRWFAKSSGTTSDKSKFIPVSFEALDQCHYQGGRDVLTMYCNTFQETELFSGKGLVIGGSHKVNSFSENSFYGDLSAVVLSNTPFWVDFLRTPDKSIALMEEWEEKLEKMAKATVNEDVTNISGVPTWTLVLIERLFEMTGKKDLHEIWPNLELYIHGGVSFTPYRERFQALVPSKGIHFMETYNASEGFFGIQGDFSTRSMFLMPGYGIFFEFVRAEQIHDDQPKAIPLWEVEPDVNYAVVITTNAGLWRYIVGDTIKFSSLRPYQFTITGRTKLFINAFGEELVIENAERGIAAACETTQAIVSDYTAAPIFMEAGQDAGHEWLIEFERMPDNLEAFGEVLDQTLKSVNSDYEAKRHKDIALKAP